MGWGGCGCGGRAEGGLDGSGGEVDGWTDKQAQSICPFWVGVGGGRGLDWRGWGRGRGRGARVSDFFTKNPYLKIFFCVWGGVVATMNQNSK